MADQPRQDDIDEIFSVLKGAGGPKPPPPKPAAEPPPPAPFAPPSAAPAAPAPPAAAKMELEPLAPAPAAPPRAPAGMDFLSDVNVDVRVELGSARMNVQDVLKLGSGAVVPLDSLVGDPVSVYVNDRLVARGEVLVVKENFAIRVTEVIPLPKA